MSDLKPNNSKDHQPDEIEDSTQNSTQDSDENTNDYILGTLITLVMEHSIEAVLAGLATVCRMGEQRHNNAKDYPRAGDYAHYAHVLECLFEG